MSERKIFDEKIDIVVVAFMAVVFLYFAIFGQVVECGDSFQYENQLPMREPVYSLLLQFFQLIAGEGYMKAVGVFQNILTFVCSWWSYKRLKDIFGFGPVFSIGVGGALLAPHLMTPLASKTHLILTNTIMTEGITIGIYYVWFAMLISMLWGYYQDRKKYINVSIVNIVLALILAMTRGQMILCLVIWLLVNAYMAICSKKRAKEIVVIVLGLAIATLATVVFKNQLTKWYNQAETGYYVNTVSSKPMMLANLVYVCDKDDSQYIQDEDLKVFFEKVVELAKENELTMEYAPSGIIAKGRFHESGHETINFDFIDSEIRSVILDRYGIDASEFVYLIIKEDELCGEVISQLLPHVFGKYLKNYFYIAILGFVRSVSVEKSVFVFWAVLAYLLAGILTICGFRKDNSSKYALTMLLVIVVICGTVFGTSLMIECITRYMIYNLPFFYIAGMGLIKQLYLDEDLRKS